MGRQRTDIGCSTTNSPRFTRTMQSRFQRHRPVSPRTDLREVVSGTLLQCPVSGGVPMTGPDPFKTLLPLVSDADGGGNAPS